MTINRLIDRSPTGLSDAAEMAAMGDIAMLNPFRYHVFANEFDNYLATDWVFTKSSAGATAAIIDGDGGLIAFTNVSAGATDEVSIQYAGNSGGARLSQFWDATKDMIVKSRFMISDVINTVIAIGLASVDTTPVASLPTNAIYILKPTGSGQLQMALRIGGVQTTLSLGTLGIAVNATMVEIALVYTAIDGLWRAFVNDVCVGSLVAAANTPTVGLTPTLGLLNSNTVANVLTVDNYLVAKQRF